MQNPIPVIALFLFGLYLLLFAFTLWFLGPGEGSHRSKVIASACWPVTWALVAWIVGHDWALEIIRAAQRRQRMARGNRRAEEWAHQEITRPNVFMGWGKK